MQILEFLNSHLDDWEEILTQEPYHIKIKKDGEYILLSYSQLESDFYNPIVRECRGSIFKIENGKFKCVCMPFYKFANYGEGYADTIDWKTAVSYEKIDGSLIKVWYDCGWHVSTNNVIDAYTAQISAYPQYTFGQVFEMALTVSPQTFFNNLDIEYTYMFELVSPLTRVVVPYPQTHLYYLSSRNMKTFKESMYTKYWDAMAMAGVSRPLRFVISSLSDCISFVETLSKDSEGIVVCDNSFHRIKVKGPEYLIAAHAANNGIMGLSTALDLIRRNAVDDFRAYCNIHDNYLNEIFNTIKKISDDFENAWQVINPIIQNMDAKERAAAINQHIDKIYQNYIFKKISNPSLTVFEYLFHTILNSALERIVKLYRKEN